MYTLAHSPYWYADLKKSSLVNRLKAIGGLTFFADYSTNPSTLNAKYSAGDGTATFTRTGVAMYVDSSGVWKTAATGIFRITYGTYDETGWRLFDTNGKLLVGLMIESAMTNRATYCNSPSNAAWTKVNCTVDDVDATSTAPDGTSTTPSITSTATNASISQAYTDTVSGVWTGSVFIKRKTGADIIGIRVDPNGTYSNITANVQDYWTRVNVSTTCTNPNFSISITGNNNEIYIWNPQLEKNPYMTSPIPSLTTAVSRGAEVLKYAIAGNRTKSNETIYISFSTFWNSTQPTGTAVLIDTDTKRRVGGLDVATDTFNFYPDATDNADNAYTTTSPLINIKYTYNAISNITGNRASVGFNGVVEGISATNTFSGIINWGTNFNIGSRSNDSLAQISGIISSVSIFSSSHNATQLLNVYGVLK